MIRLRYLPDSIIARKVSASEFSHSLDPKQTLPTKATVDGKFLPHLNDIYEAMKQWSFMLSVLCLLLVPMATQAGESTSTRIDLSARAYIPSGQDTSQENTYNVVVVIRNGDAGHRPPPPTITLRAVYWEDDGEDAFTWHGPIPGIDVVLEDGTVEHTSASAIAHTIDTIPVTDHFYERGLLLANEEIEIVRPTHLTRAPTRTLVVQYVVVPVRGGRDILVPAKSHDEWRTVYGPVTREIIEQRDGKGSLGIIRTSDDEPEANGLEIYEERFDLRLLFSD